LFLYSQTISTSNSSLTPPSSDISAILPLSSSLRYYQFLPPILLSLLINPFFLVIQLFLPFCFYSIPSPNSTFPVPKSSFTPSLYILLPLYTNHYIFCFVFSSESRFGELFPSLYSPVSSRTVYYFLTCLYCKKYSHSPLRRYTASFHLYLSNLVISPLIHHTFPIPLPQSLQKLSFTHTHPFMFNFAPLPLNKLVPNSHVPSINKLHPYLISGRNSTYSYLSGCLYCNVSFLDYSVALESVLRTSFAIAASLVVMTSLVSVLASSLPASSSTDSDSFSLGSRGSLNAISDNPPIWLFDDKLFNT